MADLRVAINLLRHFSRHSRVLASVRLVVPVTIINLVTHWLRSDWEGNRGPLYQPTVSRHSGVLTPVRLVVPVRCTFSQSTHTALTIINLFVCHSNYHS